MKKARLCDSILLVNRRLDDAVQGLQRLKHPKNCGLSPACFGEKLTLFEVHRASFNSYFCNIVGRSEDRDSARFEQKHRAHEKNNLDEAQMYRDLQAVEERQRIDRKPPKMRFLTEEEQREWERQNPILPEVFDRDASRGKGGQS